MKRYTCLLLLLVLLLQLALSAAAETTETTETTEATVETEAQIIQEESSRVENQCGENAFWTFSGGTLTISGAGSTDDFSEGAPWAAYRGDITAVVIDSGITYLGASAFENYDALAGVSFGDTFREAGTKAFRSCDSLTEVALPASFRVLGEESFMSCAMLKTIHFAGGMPSFRLNCLWDTSAELIFPAKNPWPLEHIIQLETSFQGRIEFLASDGTDPYVPEGEETEPTTEPTVETTQATTEATTEPTTEPTTVPTTAPTEAVTVPTEAETVPVYTTEETQPEKPQRVSGGGVGLAITLCIVSVVLLAILIAGKLRSGGKYSR